jgi:hypothetical protein
MYYITRRVPVRCYGQNIFSLSINLDDINISCLKFNINKTNLKINAQIFGTSVYFKGSSHTHV